MGKTISSELLGREPTEFGAQSAELAIYDGLKTPISDDAIELSDRHAKQIREFVAAAARQFGDSNGTKEPTFAQTNFDVPSLVARVDATIQEGEIVPYEMEDSPSGQGITDYIHRAVAGVGIRGVILEHYDTLLGTLPTIVVSAQRGHGTDDKVIVGEENYCMDTPDKQATLPSGPVIVKAIPGIATSHEPYLSLQPTAVAPLVTEGDKSYLERLGILRPISTDDELLMGEDGELASQVVKARIGSMAMGVEMFLRSEDRGRLTKAGTVTASRLRRTVELFNNEKGGALVQPFVPPIEIRNPEGRSRAILRVFALLGREAVPKIIGGCYVARQNLVVHGSSDAVSGAVLYNGDTV